jgi:hypothetical protein
MLGAVRPLLLLVLVSAAALAQTTAIRNGTVIDVLTGGSRRATVVVTGAKIISVGAARIPKRAKVIDASGKFIIPGLWDMHVHLWESDPMFDLYTAHGITGIRDMGSDYIRTRRWGKAALSGTGPYVFTSGSPVDGPASESAKFTLFRVSSPEDGRRAADTLDNQGVDFLNLLSTVPRNAYFALAQRARVRRAIFAGHVPESVSVAEAIDARQRSVEHLFGIAIACSTQEKEVRRERAAAIARRDNAALRELRERTYATYSESKAMDLFRRMARFDVSQVPTLTLRQRLALIGAEERVAYPRGKSVPKAIREAWTDPRAQLKDISPETLQRLREDYEFHQRLVGLMSRMGVNLLAGTDTGDPYVIPGAALHDELALLVDAGLTPLEAIRTATSNVARYFNLEASFGTIDRGKSADLVILNANPLDDIRNTQRIWAVMVRGKLMDRKRLDAKLAFK